MRSSRLRFEHARGQWSFDTDEHPRADTTLDSLSRLKPVFKKGGTVTAGNASGLNDAGSCVIMMSADRAESLGVTPLARVVSSAPGSVEPRVMGMGVVPAVTHALKFAGMGLDQIDYFEFNEAFAAQVIGCNREFGLDTDRINAAGSGISLGHPVGATGVRLIVTMINQLRRRNERLGLRLPVRQRRAGPCFYCGGSLGGVPGVGMEKTVVIPEARRTPVFGEC